MSKPDANHEDEPRPEYDFTGGVRGKYAEREASEASAPTSAQRRELGRRLKAIDARDDQSAPWSVVRDRIRSKR